MPSASEIANQIERTVTGPMWHGSALNDLLDGVTHEQAAARPIAGAHTIWELVLHITAWADIARDRLNNKSLGSQPDDIDWPAVPAPSEATWAQARSRLTTSHQMLASETSRLTRDALAAIVPVNPPQYSVATLLRGVVEHGTYHGGQIAILKKALGDAKQELDAEFRAEVRSAGARNDKQELDAEFRAEVRSAGARNDK